jgi:mRNA interferase HigB
MRLIAYSTLQDFWRVHAETEASLRVWASVMRNVSFENMAEVQARFARAKVLNGERVRFEVAGGAYRLIAAFYFPSRTVFVKFIGSHADYDRIDALSVSNH